MSRLIKKPFTLFGLAFILLLIPFWWRVRAPVAAMLQGPPQVHAANLEVATIRAGLDAKALAAAGMSAPGVSPLVSAVNTYLLAHPADLSSADEAYGNARREVDRLQRLIQSGQGTQEDVTAYQTQKAALTAATSQRAAALNAIFEAGTAGLTQGQRLALTKIRSNRNWEVAIEFLPVERSGADWVRVREALANERISAGDGVVLDPAVASQLAIWRADPAVASATTSLGTNLPAVTSAWNAAMHE